MNGVTLGDEEGRLAALTALGILDTAPEPQYEHITELAKSALDAPVAAVTLVAADRQWFKSIRGLDVCGSPREDSFCSVAIQRAEPMVVEDAQSHPELSESAFVKCDPGLRSYLGVPLALPTGHQVGALCVIDFRPRSFTERQVDTLRNLARCVEKEFALRLRAAVDDLTGCLCRQAFMERVERALGRVRAGEADGSLAIVDLDHFKRINDTHGHDAGDLVLSAVGGAMARAFAGFGETGRIGGEEFAVLFPNLAEDDAFAALENLRRTVASLRFPDVPGLTVTTSGGLTRLERSDREPVEALRRADAALYEAKRGGRDQIVVITGDAAPPANGPPRLPKSRPGPGEPAVASERRGGTSSR